MQALWSEDDARTLESPGHSLPLIDCGATAGSDEEVRPGADLQGHKARVLFGGSQHLPVRRIGPGEPRDEEDWVAEEVPVALEFNGVSHAVMLASPLDLTDFAFGFSLSEGIIASRREIYGVEHETSPLGITLKIDVASAAFAGLKSRRRSIAGRTGCGLCGTESLAHVARELKVLPDGRPFSSFAVARAMSALPALQVLQQATGAVHAAAWCTAQGQLVLLREDVGRHNALDKLIGALARCDMDASTGFIVVTSRASFEMVQKAASAGVALLAAISAPTALAIRTAQGVRMTLVGFARQQSMVVYCGAGRLDASELPKSCAAR